MKKVVIMRGIPGSGKSYHATQIACQDYPFHVVSTDFFFMKNDKYEFNPRLIGNAHIACMKNFLDAIKGNINLIIVDNTNTCVWEYTPYLQVALAEGYEVEIVEIRCDPDIAFERQTHNVPRGSHKRMTNRFKPVLAHHKQYLTVIEN